MRIWYGVKGPKRKELVQAIAAELEEETKYLGAPSFAYEVGEYLIDKEGMLQGPDNPGLVADLQGIHSFVPENEEYEFPLQDSVEVPNNTQIPYEAELGGRVSPYMDHDEPPDPMTTLTMEMPRVGFADLALENLDKLVASKASLIKKAIGAEELPIIRTEDAIKFPWFKSGTKEELEAYLFLIQGLCETAKKRKRVTAKDKPVPNEKFAFRVFLIQLGFVGDGYKSARKILLKNLTGNSAFRDGVPPKAEVERNE